jgi:hypothetical protein
MPIKYGSQEGASKVKRDVEAPSSMRASGVVRDNFCVNGPAFRMCGYIDAAWPENDTGS